MKFKNLNKVYGYSINEGGLSVNIKVQCTNGFTLGCNVIGRNLYKDSKGQYFLYKKERYYIRTNCK